MSKFSDEKFKKLLKGFLKNPFFYFFGSSAGSQRNKLSPKHKGTGGGLHFMLAALVLFGLLFSNSDSLAQLSYFESGNTVFFNTFFANAKNSDAISPFFSQNKNGVLETPDLKIIQDAFVYGISTPRILTTQTLGDIFGGESSQNSKDIIDYSVQAGDTIDSVAQKFNISVDTVLLANKLSKNSSLTVGKNLVILPVSGIVHIVKSGDTISEISRTYKAHADEIISFNDLANEGDIFIGDILVIPGGIMPKVAAPVRVEASLVDSFFIYPAEGQVTQGLHFYNAVDVANKCGTPIYAAASGTVQRARYGWNYGGGNQITILHSDGIVTYYGHLSFIYVKSGDKVTVGDKIGLMGQTGQATGCHVHFEVVGAKNPLGKYSVGTFIKY